MKSLTIRDLPLHGAKKLTVEQKKAFVKIIENEFDNQETLVRKDYDGIREQAVSAYRKKNRLDAKIAEYQELEIKLRGIKNYLEAFGLTPTGNIEWNPSNTNNEYRLFKISLDKLQEEYSIPRTNKNKIVSKVWLCDNEGEVSVILNEVMGNGILPAITELPQIEK